MSDNLTIKIADIIIPSDPLRKTMDDEGLMELAASIGSVGLLQPIVVRKKGRKFELIAGLRRTIAHKLLRKTHILATVHDAHYELSAAAALIENIQRENLPLFDEAQAVRALVDEHGIGIPEAARRLGKGQPWIRDRLDVLRLQPELAEAVQNESISMGAALELAKIQDDHVRKSYTHYAVVGGISIQEAKRWKETALRDSQAVSTTPGNEDARLEVAPPPQLKVTCFGCDEVHTLNEVQAVHMCLLCTQAFIELKEKSYGGDEPGHDGPREDPAP